MTDMIDKKLGQFRPRPVARDDEPAGFPATIAVLGVALALYGIVAVVFTTLSLLRAALLMWGGW